MRWVREWVSLMATTRMEGAVAEAATTALPRLMWTGRWFGRGVVDMQGRGAGAEMRFKAAKSE